MTTHRGGCHCGALRFAFDSDAELTPRACQCGFCRRHGARSVSDPGGRVRLAFAVAPLAYRFGLGITDYLICPRCGIYVGARAAIDGRLYVTLNLNAFDDPHLELATTPVSYDGEAVAQRSARRRERWTPVQA